jgi:hypothetical protein
MAYVWPASLCNSGRKTLVTGMIPEGMDPTLRQAGPLASPDYSKAVKALVRRESCAMWLEWFDKHWRTKMSRLGCTKV